jgi:hypothetical protein
MSTTPEPQEQPQTNTFQLTPDQLLELQFARLKASKIQVLSDEELANYKGENYDPERERAVLSTGFAGIAATVMAGASFIGWQMSNRYLVEANEGNVKQGLMYRIGRFFKPHKMVQELEDKRIAKELAEEHARLEAEAKRLGINLNNVTSQTTPISSSTTPPTHSAGQAGKILIEKPPINTHPHLAQPPIPIPTPPSTTPIPTPAPSSTSYGKFQRKVGGTDGVEPSLKAAYDLKQAKIKAGKYKRGRKYLSMAAIPKAMKASARTRAGIAFVLSTVGLSVGSYFATRAICSFMGVKTFSQYTEWMSNEDASYRPEDLAKFTRGISSNLQQWLMRSPAKALMEMMTHELQKEQTVTIEDMQILDHASMASAYFVGYELDLYSRLLGRPSRAANPSYDEFLGAFSQPIPLTEDEYKQEQLRLLRQLAGLPDPVPEKNNV